MRRAGTVLLVAGERAAENYYILVFPEPKKPVIIVIGIMVMTTTAQTRRSEQNPSKKQFKFPRSQSQG